MSERRRGRGDGPALLYKGVIQMEENRSCCPLFGSCGGCFYGGLSYPEELREKEEKLKALFRDVLPDGFFESEAYEGITGSPVEEGYRNKMEFSFGNAEKDGPLTLGLHKRKSFYDILSVPGCRIVSGDFNTVRAAVEAYFREKNVPFYHKKTHAGALRHLVLRRNREGDLLVNLVTASNFRPEPDFVELLLSLPLSGRIAGILHTENDALSDTVAKDALHVLWGEDHLTETVLGLQFDISPFSFFQTNTEAAELLYEKARAYIALTPGSLVYDLYSGTGTIAQLLSPACDKVYGVEIVEEAVEAARGNAEKNGLANCEFIAGDVLKCLDELPPADYIILDPPRDGVNPKALAKLMRSGAGRMVYISCKPKSLARDLPMLKLGGYELQKMAFIDLFPKTDNCEAIALLSKLSEV